MFELQNLKDFVSNPMGKGSTAISNRQAIVNDLDRRLEELLKTKKMKLSVYSNAVSYVFHFVVPSESERTNDYDVVLQFSPSDPRDLMSPTIKDYVVRFFSNCPSFVFTYANVFNDNDLLIKELRNKYDKPVLRKDPIIRNPGEIVNYEKSTYFACKYILDNDSLLSKATLKTMSKVLVWETLSLKIRTEDKIMSQVQAENRRISKEKRLEKAKEEDRKAELSNAARRAAGVQKPKEKKGSSVNRIKTNPKIKSRGPTINKIRPK